MIGCACHNLVFLNCFLLSWDVSYVRLRCGRVSVCRLFLVSSFEPYRELVRLVCLVVLKCNGIVCLLMLYSKLVAIGTTSFCGCTVTKCFCMQFLAFRLFTRNLLQLLRLNWLVIFWLLGLTL